MLKFNIESRSFFCTPPKKGVRYPPKSKPLNEYCFDLDH